mgnify:CR=1 FL=1
MNDSLRDTIKPKSDQINSDDLIAGPITVRITGVQRSKSPDQPVDVLIEGHMPMRPCKSMRRVMIAVWGERGAEWIGHRMTLYRDPNVTFGGVVLGGVRISHMSGIEKPIEIMLTTKRSRRAPFRVEPLGDDAASQNKSAPINESTGECWTPDDVIQALEECRDKSELDLLRGIANQLRPGLSADYKRLIKEGIEAAEKEASAKQATCQGEP